MLLRRTPRLIVATRLLRKGRDAREKRAGVSGTAGGPFLWYHARDLGLRLVTLDLLLESLDFVPGFQPSTHDTKIELFHENEILVHVEEYFPGNLLLFEDIAVLRLDPDFT